jgi:Ca2+-binding RTX toxin-like protein
MENNIGIAYGAVVENAVGGHGDGRINGNQAFNKFTGGAGADTFILADYTGFTVPLTTGGTSTVLGDDSIDTITDFDSGVDKIDLSQLGVTQAQLTSVSSVVNGINTTTITIDREGLLDDFIFIVQGEAPVITDYHFGG